MIDSRKLRTMWESMSRESGGKLAFVNKVRNMLGLADENGNDYHDHVGNRTLKNPEVKPEEFSLQGMGEAILGHDTFSAVYNPARQDQFSRAVQLQGFVESTNPGNKAAMVESTGVGLDPSGFQNINAYTILTTGLMEVKILEAFKNPTFIADQVMPSEATKLNGQKVIGLNPLFTDVVRRQPGQKHARTGFGERWIQTPETRENAMAIDVTKEVIFFDKTGDMLRNAQEVGEIIAYNREIEMLDVILGVQTGNTFTWNGTAYATYSTSTRLGQTNGNAITNDLLDWTAFQTAVLTMSRFTDPDTARRILVNPNSLIVSPGKYKTAELILGSTRTERRYGTGATTPQTTSNPLMISDTPSNPYAGQFSLLTSPLIEQRLVDKGGLTTAQATERWYLLEAGKCFKYMVNYPLQVQSASPQSYNMIDQGIAMSFFAGERGIPSVWSVWHALQNSGS